MYEYGDNDWDRGIASRIELAFNNDDGVPKLMAVPSAEGFTGIWLNKTLGEEWLKIIWRNGTANLTTVSGFAEGVANSFDGCGAQEWASGA